MLIQIHMLQNYAPSNLNRDDTGSPKDAFFGGIKRGRISSQCLKRSMRTSEVFKDAFGDHELLATRTRRLPTLIDDELAAMGVDNEARKAIVARVPEIGRESGRGAGAQGGEGDLETKQLIFVGANEVRPMAERLLEFYRQDEGRWEKHKIAEITRELGSSLPRSVDIAMFGRMTTSEAFEDIQAAVQVAHALSSNGVMAEFDYFTAVDDISGESGAGMIGDVEFNSSTYYKYLNVHWEQLVFNLGGDEEVAGQSVLALLEAAATAQPSGKQNSFAAFNLPDLILVEVSDRNLPVSYANAFIQPARQRYDRSLMEVSVEQLNDYMASVRKTYNLDGQRAFTAIGDFSIPDADHAESLDDLKEWLAGQLGG